MNNLMQFVLYAVFGCIIGVANIIPGVSGGTMAVILNIYDKLIDAVTGILKRPKQSLLFLIPVAIGGGLGIFGFAKLLDFLLASYPMPTFFFFIGLIIGTVPMMFQKVITAPDNSKHFNPLTIIPFLLFFGAMIALSFFNEDTASDTQIQLSFMNWLYLFFGSALAAMCMIIPGVSGSMILMILGLYTTVLGSVSRIASDFTGSAMILLPAGLGILVGILGGAKLIDLCLKHFPQMTFAAILGLMLGSLLSIYNNAHFAFNIQGLISVISLIVGAAVAFIFSSDFLKQKLALY